MLINCNPIQFTTFPELQFSYLWNGDHKPIPLGDYIKQCMSTYASKDHTVWYIANVQQQILIPTPFLEASAFFHQLLDELSSNLDSLYFHNIISEQNIFPI